MIYPISLLSGGIYKHIVKPILFRVHPDKMHADMITIAARVQKINLLRRLLRTCWDSEHPALQQKLLGIEFNNPLGLSAGLDNDAKILGVTSAIGFGQTEFGSITFEKCAGNPHPWFYRLPKTKSIVVNKGLANDGTKKILKRLSGYSQKQICDMKINVNVAYTNKKQTKTEREAIADYVGSFKLINDYIQSGQMPRISLADLNISCPNTYGGEPFTTPVKLERLLKALDAIKLQIPLFIKMPVDKTPAEFDKLLDVILRHDVQGVTIANLFKNRAETQLADDLPDSVGGNLSGRPTFTKSNQLIAQTYQKCTGKLVITGVGGVFTAEDAYAKIRAGANLVEMVTGLMFEGPQVVGQINRGLVKLVKRDGLKNIAEAVGLDAKKVFWLVAGACAS